jgi:hypothetical protein
VLICYRSKVVILSWYNNYRNEPLHHKQKSTQDPHGAHCRCAVSVPTLQTAPHVRPSRCITVEDEIARFDGRVAGKAGVVYCLAGGFAVVKLSEPQPPVEAYFLPSLIMN